MGKLIPARDSLKIGGLPIGLAHNLVLKNNIPQGQRVTWSDVEYSESNQAIKVRKEMETMFRSTYLNGVNGKTNGVRNGV